MSIRSAHLSRRAPLLAALAVPLLVGVAGPAVAAPAGATAPAANDAAQQSADDGWVRAGHLVAGADKADVRLTPFKGGRTLVLSSIDYGEISAYRRVPAGLYTVALVPPGEGMASAMVRESVRVEAGSAATVFATGTEDDVTARVVQDDLTPPPTGQARIRLVSAASEAPTVDASVVGGPDLAQDAALGSVTGYADVPGQTWRVQVAASDGDAGVTRAVTVKAGSVYTLLVLDKAGGGIRLVPTVDSAGATAMPTGGVDTGGGYLSTLDEPFFAQVLQAAYAGAR